MTFCKGNDKVILADYILMTISKPDKLYGTENPLCAAFLFQQLSFPITVTGGSEGHFRLPEGMDDVFIECVSNGRLTSFSKKNFKSLFDMAG